MRPKSRNYKSPDFDAVRALQNNTMNLRAMLAAMKPRGLKAVCLTGSVFEPDEGVGDAPPCVFALRSVQRHDLPVFPVLLP